MPTIDMTWLSLGLLLLACGAVPALLALAGERRTPGATLRHELGSGLSAAELGRLRRSLPPMVAR